MQSRSLIAHTLALGALMAVISTTAHAADVVVTITNIQSANGTIMVGLIDTPDGFPQKIKIGQKVPAAMRDANGKVKVTFNNVAPGEIAVTAYQDLDDNGKLNVNLMGMPTEPYGFSRNAHGNFGPPTYKDASFIVPAEGVAIEFELQGGVNASH